MNDRNRISLSLLHNDKVYQSKELAIQGLNQSSTNDGVAKLARYLEDGLIKTVVGFYANADEMTVTSGGQSTWSIIDIDGNADNIEEISGAVAAVNAVIGLGFTSANTIADAIVSLNDKIGSGFTSANTVADSLIAIASELGVTLEEAQDPGVGNSKTYILSQGGTELGRIEIPQSSSSLVQGDGILISADTISVVAAEYSDVGVNNPISVDNDGIKFDSSLDCGYFDNE